MDTFAQDIRYACARCAGTPAFTAAAVLSLAIGIGANTAIFSVASALLLRPLAVRRCGSAGDPLEPLARDWASPRTGSRPRSTSTSRVRSRASSDVAIAIGANYNLTGEAASRSGSAPSACPRTCCRCWACGPVLGRFFEPDEDVRADRRRHTRSRHLGASLRRRPRRHRADADAERPAVCRSSASLPESFSCRERCMPTLGGAEDAEIVLPLPLGRGADVRGREDYNILGRLEAWRRR